MASGDPVTRGEFDAGMESIRERVDSVKEVMVERLTRAETLLERVDDRALADAEDRGRTKAQLEGLEKQQEKDRRTAEARANGQDLWIRGGVIVILGGGLAFVLNLIAAGVR